MDQISTQIPARQASQPDVEEKPVDKTDGLSDQELDEEMDKLDKQKADPLRQSLGHDGKMQHLAREMKNVQRRKLWKEGRREEKLEGSLVRKQYNDHFLQKYIDGQVRQMKEMELALERMRAES